VKINIKKNSRAQSDASREDGPEEQRTLRMSHHHTAGKNDNIQ
jgi:hypothetical protein